MNLSQKKTNKVSLNLSFSQINMIKKRKTNFKVRNLIVKEYQISNKLETMGL